MCRISLSIAAALVATSMSFAAEQKPNVLVFVCDDVGWAELGFQGNEDIPTPHIDSISKNGVRFTNGYVTGPYCAPTRAGLMTGRYQTRFGFEFNSTAHQSGIPDSETTIAQRVKSLGYSTCAIGKWHLGTNPPYQPMQKGFDEFYGTLLNTPFFHPTNFVDSRVSPEAQKTIEDPDFYTTDAYAERAAEWLGRQKKDQPWFLYVPFNAQHAPLEAPPEYVNRFKHIKDERRRIFAGMMYAMDQAVGKVLNKVRELGQEENTLVFFVSDNGGPTRQTTSRNDPLRGFKSTTWEGGVRVPFCVQWKGTLPAGKTYEHPVIQLDILPTALAAAGANIDPQWKLDGVNLLPYLKGDNADRPHETLFWRFGDQWAIRHGDWKLVVGRDGDPKGELFNLVEDKEESNNLAAEEPEKYRELKSLWDEWNAEQAAPVAKKEPPKNRQQRQRQLERQLRKQRARQRAAAA